MSAKVVNSSWNNLGKSSAGARGQSRLIYQTVCVKEKLTSCCKSSRLCLKEKLDQQWQQRPWSMTKSCISDATINDTGVNTRSQREQHTHYIQMASLAQETALCRHNIWEWHWSRAQHPRTQNPRKSLAQGQRLHMLSFAMVLASHGGCWSLQQALARRHQCLAGMKAIRVLADAYKQGPSPDSARLDEGW